MRKGEAGHAMGPAGPVKQAFESYGRVAREVKSVRRGGVKTGEI
jgi:hypothetical protein